MKNTGRHIEDFLESQGVTFVLQKQAEREDIEKRWLREFAKNVKSETGSWVHAKFKWHGFSYKYETAIEGSRAVQEYQRQWAASYFVFDEDGTWSYGRTSEKYPDFTPIRADIYVVHHNMKWTMVFTHEQPNNGPYFTKR
ncbi:MAG: DUF4275 family protein [Pseudomonadota bacterium]